LQSQSVAIGQLRQWPDENKIAIAQFAHAGKFPSTESTAGVRSVIVRRVPTRATQVSSFGSRIWRMTRAQSAQLWNSKKCRRDHNCAFASETNEGQGGSQMLRPATTYPIIMGTLVICQVSLLALLVWMFR
jgi:hypothetical protein